MKKLRWGILSTAKIAREWVIPALQESPHCEVVALASRDAERGQQAAQEHKIPKVFSSYEDLLACPDVDAIYNPLPNHLHVPFSKHALEAGKHVLCEKPLGLNAAEVQSLIEVSEQYPDQLMMEAFMYRFHPQWQQVVEWLEQGKLGTIQSVDANFSFFNRDAKNVRNQPGIGGGSLMDVGCYCISVARLIFGRDPKQVMAQMDIDPEFNVDRHTTAILDFAPGTATFFCSTQSAPTQSVRIIGDKASLTIESPFYRRQMPARLILREDNDDHVVLIDQVNHYVEQVNAFALAALAGNPAPTSLVDALANINVMDAVVRSAEHKSWTQLK